MAQRRLAALFQEGRIKRNTQIAPYLYYVKAQKEPLKRIGVNWVRLWMIKRCKTWERTTFDYNSNTCTVINTVTGISKEYLITDKIFRFPKDNLILLTDETIYKIKEELM